nr:SDR family NAD(P)-dependent oxidoreductase [Microvirga sp. HBU65207]
MTLAGKVALVTCGSRGLGRAIAQALATEGAHVAITYIASAGKAEAVVRDIEAKAVRGFAFQSDQGDPQRPNRLSAVSSTISGNSTF